MTVRYTAIEGMEETALRDVDRNAERWRDKIEVRLDNRQVFFLFFGSAMVACLLFVLGVIVGKRLESRGRAEMPSVQDPLAALDFARLHDPGQVEQLIRRQQQADVPLQALDLRRAEDDAQPRGAGREQVEGHGWHLGRPPISRPMLGTSAGATGGAGVRPATGRGVRRIGG